MSIGTGFYHRWPVGIKGIHLSRSLTNPLNTGWQMATNISRQFSFEKLVV